MSSYYDTLEISPDATYQEVKKAYFSLIRKYPPERYPEEFMQIREAYEVLSDEKTRRQYDEIDSLQENMKNLVSHSQKALEKGEPKEAIKQLEQIVKYYPDSSVIKNLLGEAYNLHGNTGKAVKIFKELARKEPQHAGFAGKLAHAYFNRGWHKKAIAQYRKALNLDQDNISLWLGLINCYMEARDYITARETAFEALEISRINGWDNLELYYHIILLDLMTGNQEDFKQHLSEMKKKALESDEERSNMAWFLATISQKLQQAGRQEESNLTINTASDILPDDEEILKIKEDINYENSIIAELEALNEDSSIERVFKDAIELEFETNSCDCIDCSIIRLNMEANIVTNIEKMRTSARRIKAKYPTLYNLKKEFFDLVINPKNDYYLFESYAKKYEWYQKHYPDYFDDEDFDEEDVIFFPTKPVRREGPKIGRNDPCYCGSGKKYKKCCGK